MYSSQNNTIFHAQHKNKCYCQNGNTCYCTGNENLSSNSKQSYHKFTKVRSDKVKQNKSTSVCSTNCFSPAPTMMNSITASSSGVCFSDPKLTGRRELYERSKLEGGFIHKFDIRTWNTQDHTLCSDAEHSGLFSEEQIAKLQEFRLQNADECLSSCKKFSMNQIKQFGKSKEPVKETKYTLNNRGLLKIIGGNCDEGAAVVSSKSAVRDILRQKFNASKNKDELFQKALCLPENSLALRYQKTY